MESDKNLKMFNQEKIVDDLVNDDEFERLQEELTQKKNKNGFRFASNSFFLTYPQFDISPEEFFKKFQQQMLTNGKEIKMAVVSREDHKNSQGKHIHVYGKFGVRVDTRNSRYFDIEGHHPHVEPVKSPVQCIKYVAGYTLKKMNDKKDLHCFKIDLAVFLYNKKNHKSLNLEELCKKQISFVDWVDTNFNNVKSFNSIMKNVQLYWNFKSVHQFQNKRACFWIYGEPGIGKSYSILNRFCQDELYRKAADNKWWDGYTDQRVVLIDDFDSKNYYHEFKIWADQYLFKGEIKGGFVNCCYSVLFITSNYSIKYLFSKKKYVEGEEEIDEDDAFSTKLVAALERRFNIINADEYIVKEDKNNSNIYFDFDLAFAGFEEQLNYGIVKPEEPKENNNLPKVEEVKPVIIYELPRNLNEMNEIDNTSVEIPFPALGSFPIDYVLNLPNVEEEEIKKEIEEPIPELDEINTDKPKKKLKLRKMRDLEIEVIRGNVKEKIYDESTNPNYKEINLKDLEENDNDFDVDKVYEKEKEIAESLKDFIVDDDKSFRSKAIEELNKEPERIIGRKRINSSSPQKNLIDLDKIRDEYANKKVTQTSVLDYFDQRVEEIRKELPKEDENGNKIEYVDIEDINSEDERGFGRKFK